MKEYTGELIGGSKPWIARIIGPDPKFNLARKFENGVVDYSKANSKRTRGVKTTWLLSNGIYEINLPKSWNRADRRFIKIDGDNEITMSASDVLREVANA